MGLMIRDALAHDSGGVSALLTEMGYPASPEEAEAHIVRYAQGHGSRLQIAETGGVLVGLIGTHIVPRMDKDHFSCRVTDLVVSAHHRRAGIGLVLLTAAENEARRASAPRLDLSSGDWRAEAHAFYLRMGFQTRSRGFTKRLE